jgi:hypothetical protein
MGLNLKEITENTDIFTRLQRELHKTTLKATVVSIPANKK